MVQPDRLPLSDANSIIMAHIQTRAACLQVSLHVCLRLVGGGTISGVSARFCILDLYWTQGKKTDAASIDCRLNGGLPLQTMTVTGVSGLCKHRVTRSVNRVSPVHWWHELAANIPSNFGLDPGPKGRMPNWHGR